MAVFKNRGRVAYDLFILKRKAYDLFLWSLAKAIPFEPKTLPKFLMIGSSRSGTTWLHHVLRQHPDVFCPKVKEIHFFDRGSLRNRGTFKFDPKNKAQWRWYALNFLLGKGKLIGDITPAYACLDHRLIQIIAQHLPHVKIIYSFRNPVERAWSGVRKSFKENGVYDISHIAEQELIERATTPNQYAASAYADNIKRWESIFPTGQIHYSFYDDLQDDPFKFLAPICQFLDVSMDPVSHLVSRQPINRAPAHEPSPLLWEELVKLYKPHIEYLEQRFDRDLSHWITRPGSQASVASNRETVVAPR